MNLEHGSIAHAGVSHHSRSIALLEFQKGYFRAMLSLYCGRKCFAQTLAALRKKKQKQFIFQFPINFWSVFFAIYIYICFLLQPDLSSCRLTFLTDGFSRTDQRRKTFAVHIPYFALITPFLFGKIVRFSPLCVVSPQISFVRFVSSVCFI